MGRLPRFTLTPEEIYMADCPETFEAVNSRRQKRGPFTGWIPTCPATNNSIPPTYNCCNCSKTSRRAKLSLKLKSDLPPPTFGIDDVASDRRIRRDMRRCKARGFTTFKKTEMVDGARCTGSVASHRRA